MLCTHVVCQIRNVVMTHLTVINHIDCPILCSDVPTNWEYLNMGINHIITSSVDREDVHALQISEHGTGLVPFGCNLIGVIAHWTLYLGRSVACFTWGGRIGLTICNLVLQLKKWKFRPYSCLWPNQIFGSSLPSLQSCICGNNSIVATNKKKTRSSRAGGRCYTLKFNWRTFLH